MRIATVLNIVLLTVLFRTEAAESEWEAETSPRVDPRVEKLKLNLHRLLESSRIRRKRQLEEPNAELYDGKLRFGNSDVADLPYLSDYNLTFWIPVRHESLNQVLIGTTKGDLILFQLSGVEAKTATVVAISSHEEIAEKAAAFSHESDQWFVVLQHLAERSRIQVYKRVGRGLERRMKMEFEGRTDMDFITLRRTHYLAVATYSKATNIGYSYQATVALYRWADTQFDRLTYRSSSGARSVDCWVLDGSLYIVVGQEVNDDSNFRVGSPIYLYNSKEQNELVLWQTLETYGPIKAKHFEVAGNHYVIFIGKGDAVIYWWTSGQFLEWQRLDGTAFASDVVVISLGNGEVAIVIALVEQALFYTLDASGYYILSLPLSFSGSTVKSLQFMFIGNAYYLLALFMESMNRHQIIYKLALVPDNLPSLSSLDPLKQCLFDVSSTLIDRQNKLIKQDIGRIWLRDGNQTVTTTVKVKGQIISKKESSIKNVIILKESFPNFSTAYVLALVSHVKELTEGLNQDLNSVVRKSTAQEIGGVISFKDPVFVPSLTMKSTSNDLMINGESVARIYLSALRNSGKQTFPNSVFVSDMYSGNAIFGKLNEVKVDDLLLLHGKQVVSGSLTLASVELDNLSTTTINQYDVRDLVTTNMNQEIKDLKRIYNLQSSVIGVHGETNGRDLDDISMKVVTIDGYDDISGRLQFTKPVTVNGDVFMTGKINKYVDLSELITKGVTVGAQQDLTGLYTFKDDQEVDGDILIHGSVNDVSLHNILTLTSNQVVYSDMTISSVNINNDLEVQTINNVDIDIEAIRKDLEYQFAAGQKIFTKDITADFVDMTEYVKLDGVDPSLLVQDIVQHRQGVVKHDTTTFKDVHVTGNLTALDGINGHKIIDLPDLAWLKSTPQAINLPVAANSLQFQFVVDAETINGIRLDYDVVHVFGNQDIASTKIFKNNVQITTKLRVKDATINGINPSSIKHELDRYTDDSSIYGAKEFDTLSIEGDVKTISTNNINFPTEVMLPDARQIVEGKLSFSAELTAILDSLNVNTLESETINSLNVADYFRRAVSTNKSLLGLSDVQFSKLQTPDLVLHPGSLINGVSLQETMQRVVTLNTPQQITAEKSFISLDFKSSIIVPMMNGIDFLEFLPKVVLTNEDSDISNKHFTGNVKAETLFVRGLVNNVKIEDMAANAFSKSQNNEVGVIYSFPDDIDIANLLVNSFLDGVRWSDVISLKNDEVMNMAFFLSNVKAAKEIFIIGQLNGCDLSELASRILYANHSSQTVTGEVKIEKITIDGNLIINEKLNNISIDAMEKFIMLDGDKVVTSDVWIGAGVKILDLNLNFVNGESLLFLLNDAVKKSIPQVIQGVKSFQNLLATVLSGKSLYVHGKLSGIDLHEMWRTAVWKSGFQKIEGDKILANLATYVATINGHLNGLKLPADVIRTDAAELIDQPTYFMSDIFLTSDLHVHGLVDGVNIEDLIKNRVTLYSSQNITSRLFFVNDVTLYDELTIDGTVNELDLELVARIKPAYPLQGYKVFAEMHVSGSLKASKVNNLDINELEKQVLLYNKDDFISEIQVFSKNINAQNSLFAEWINNFPASHLIEVFSSFTNTIKTVVGFFEDFTSNLHQQINRQFFAAKDKISNYAYFILHQEIDVAPTNKILHAYKLDDSLGDYSHSMVMWTSQKHCAYMEKCCHLEFSYWLRVKKSGFVIVDGTPESGRYYPVENPGNALSSDNFFIWTNASKIQPKWCDENGKKMYLASYTKEGFFQVHMDISGVSQISDLKSFRKDHLYVVVSFYYDNSKDEFRNTVVYKFNEVNRRWSELQAIPAFGVLSMDIATSADNYDIFLALGTGIERHPSSYSTIYRWSEKNEVFDFFQDIPSKFVTSTLWIQKGSNLLLALANVENWPRCGTVSGGHIDIYDYSGQFTWIQSIPLRGTVSMITFSVDGETYLVAASYETRSLHIYEWQGYAGFAEVQTIFAGEVKHLNVFFIDDETYMTVVSESASSKVLKLVQRGKRKATSSGYHPAQLEQKDEVAKQKVVTGC